MDDVEKINSVMKYLLEGREKSYKKFLKDLGPENQITVYFEGQKDGIENAIDVIKEVLK